jgi:hypothetical protein
VPRLISPHYIAHTELKGDLKADIESTFGSVENFNKEFSTAGATQVQLQQCCRAGCLSFSCCDACVVHCLAVCDTQPLLS